MSEPNPSFILVMRKLLALSGEKLLDFGKQVTSLSAEDKLWFYTELRAAGYVCEPPKGVEP